MKIDHQFIKHRAKESGTTIKDLIVLDKENDPFYIGTETHWMWARWFADTWGQYGQEGDYLRKFHYRIEAKGINLPKPLKREGKIYRTYINHKGCWEQLLKAAKFARYLGLVDPDSFVDRRNPRPIEFIEDRESDNPRFFVPEGDWGLPSLPDEALPEFDMPEAAGYEDIEQSYHVEIWCEKTTMNDVLMPVCRRYGVNLVTAGGHPTITAVREFLRRVQKPARVLYISDHDHAGKQMPAAVARKLQFYQQEEFDHLDIKLESVVLTAEQVAKYDLPREPTAKMEKTELDALEALYPGELAKIVEREVKRYIDLGLKRKGWREKERLQDHLDEVFQATRANYERETGELERDYSEFLQELKPLQEKLNGILNRYRELNDRIKGDLKNAPIDLSEFPLPEPDIDGDPDGLLYESSRDYFEQLDAYKKRSNGDG